MISSEVEAKQVMMECSGQNWPRECQRNEPTIVPTGISLQIFPAFASAKSSVVPIRGTPSARTLSYTQHKYTCLTWKIDDVLSIVSSLRPKQEGSSIS